MSKYMELTSASLVGVILTLLIFGSLAILDSYNNQVTCVRGGYIRYEVILGKEYCVGYDLEGQLMIEEYQSVVERVE